MRLRCTKLCRVVGEWGALLGVEGLTMEVDFGNVLKVVFAFQGLFFI